MKQIDEAVLNYLSMKTSGALLLTGVWGSGKTHYLKNHLFKIKEQLLPRLNESIAFLQEVSNRSTQS